MWCSLGMARALSGNPRMHRQAKRVRTIERPGILKSKLLNRYTLILFLVLLYIFILHSYPVCLLYFRLLFFPLLLLSLLFIFL